MERRLGREDWKNLPADQLLTTMADQILADRNNVGYLEEVSASSKPLFNSLEVSYKENKGNFHSAFWISYLDRYGMLASSIRKQVDTLGWDNQIHKEAVEEWIKTQVSPTIEETRNVFDIQRFDSKIRLLAEIIEPEYVGEYETDIMEIPSRMMKENVLLK